MQDKSIHLVCSSGGVRCYSYIGAYKKLQEAGYSIESVAASSMGSVIGLLICAGLNAADLERLVLDFPLKDIVKRKHWLPLVHFLKYPFAKYYHPDYEKLLISILGNNPKLGDLKIPFATVAIDIRQRELLTYSSATNPDLSCAEVLKLATAIPPLFEAYTPPGSARLLVDAGVGTESPAWLLASLAGTKPIVVLKTARPSKEIFRNGFAQFLGNMVSSAAASNDKFSMDQLPNAIPVEINVGDQKAEDFTIDRATIEKLILEGYSEMQDTLKRFNGNLHANLHVENIASKYRPEHSAETAGHTSRLLMDSYLHTLTKRNQVFISYSHKDRDWFDRFQTFFKPIEEFSNIKIWDDQEIMPGDLWKQAIDESLENTRVAFCLVTKNFLASDFIVKNELSYFLEASAKKQIKIFWVAVGHALVDHTPLSQIQCANNPMEPLEELIQNEAALDKAMANICRKLVQAMG